MQTWVADSQLPTANKTASQLTRFGVKLPISGEEDNVSSCVTIAVEPSGRSWSMSGNVHLVGFSCFEGEKDTARLWSTSQSYSISNEGKVSNKADCIEVVTDRVSWSKCDLVCWSLEITATSGVTTVFGTYTIHIDP